MPKRRLIVHAVGGIGHHQARVGPGEEPDDIRRRRRVPAREAVAAELEHVAVPDCGRGGRGQHGVLVGLRLRPLRGEQPGELRGRVADLTAFFGRAARAAALTTHQIRQYQLARRAAGAAGRLRSKRPHAATRGGGLLPPLCLLVPVQAYVFDRQLRLAVMDAIERVEIAIRTALVTELAMRHGAFAHVDRKNFPSAQMVVWSASRPRSRSSSSTSRNESEYRRYQRTAHRISPGSVCRHLNIAGRIAFFMISSGYQPPSATVATQPSDDVQLSPLLGDRVARWVRLDQAPHHINIGRA